MKTNGIALEDIVAIVPKYIDLRGNCTIAYDQEGQPYEIYRTVSTVLNWLAEYYLVDLRAARGFSANILAIRNLPPIPFNMENVFVPVKVRKPLFRNDGSFGYVNIEYVEDIVEEDATYINLNNGVSIRCLCSLPTVSRHIRNGHIIKKFWEGRSPVQTEETDLYGEYNQPATKWDIALLREEILKMKEAIK